MPCQQGTETNIADTSVAVWLDGAEPDKIKKIKRKTYTQWGMVSYYFFGGSWDGRTTRGSGILFGEKGKSEVLHT